MDSYIGMVLFVVGGIAGALYPASFKKVHNWAYECYWFTFVIFGLLVMPLLIGLGTVNNFFGVLLKTPPEVFLRVLGFGMLWGLGSVCFGLTLRYLGVGLAVAMVSGICASVGTFLPPIVKGQAAELVKDTSAILVLTSIVVLLLGIAIIALAAWFKDNELSEEEKKKAVPEYNFAKGVVVVLIAGIASAAFNFGLQAGDVMNGIAIQEGTSSVWQGVPVMFVTLLGCVITNSIWCIWQLSKNKNWGQFFDPSRPIWRNFFWAGLLPGLIWAVNPLTLKVGEPMMKENAYVGFPILMATTFLVGVLIGIFSGEWKGVSRKTGFCLALGLVIMLAFAALYGYAKYIAPGA